MGKTDPIPAGVLGNLQTKLPDVLAATSTIPPGGPNVVDEILTSYSVWFLDERAISAGGARLEDLATFTGNWHHEIARSFTSPGGQLHSSRMLGAVTTQARPSPDTIWDIVGFTQDAGRVEFAREIRNAAYWVDQHYSGEFILRLLIIPSRYLHAFWLKWDEEDGIVIIDAPQAASFEYGRLYYLAEFVDKLRESLAPAGIPDRR